MSKTLEDRLRDAKAALGTANAALGRHVGKVPSDVEVQFRTVIDYDADIEHWIGLLHARAAASALLADLEKGADANDCVPLGTARVKFQHVRRIGVQAYLSTTWSLADRVAGMVGRVLCTPDAGFNEASPAQLVSQFVQKERKKTTAAAVFESVRQTFGWPIGLSYAIRNHFVHDGAQVAGSDFFDGPTAASKFGISLKGWMRVEDRAKTYGVEPGHHRAGPSWPATPRDDLRALLEVCEREMDDALGVLLGSACGSLLTHVACMLGED